MTATSASWRSTARSATVSALSSGCTSTGGAPRSAESFVPPLRSQQTFNGHLTDESVLTIDEIDVAEFFPWPLANGGEEFRTVWSSAAFGTSTVIKSVAMTMRYHG